MGFFDRLLGRSPGTDTTTDTANAAAPAPMLSVDEQEQTDSRITEIRSALEAGNGEPADLHEELGALHERTGDLDGAITAYESSLDERPRYGESYNRLMDLYNTKRSQAAAAGDGNAINQWMSRIDALLATSKRIMRENY